MRTTSLSEVTPLSLALDCLEVCKSYCSAAGETRKERCLPHSLALRNRICKSASEDTACLKVRSVEYVHAEESSTMLFRKVACGLKRRSSAPSRNQSHLCSLGVFEIRLVLEERSMTMNVDN